MNKILTLIILYLSSLISLGADSTGDKIQVNMAKLIPKGCNFSSDGNSLIWQIDGVKILHRYSLPIYMNEKEIWENFGRKTNFHIMVKLTGKLSQAEYKNLSTIRSQLLEGRVSAWEQREGEKINQKSLHGLSVAVNDLSLFLIVIVALSLFGFLLQVGDMLI